MKIQAFESCDTTDNQGGGESNMAATIIEILALARPQENACIAGYIF